MIPASGTNHTCPEKVSTARRESAVASRVFPVPPTPTIVITGKRSTTRSQTAASSSSRPISSVRGEGSIPIEDVCPATGRTYPSRPCGCYVVETGGHSSHIIGCGNISTTDLPVALATVADALTSPNATKDPKRFASTCSQIDGWRSSSNVPTRDWNAWRIRTGRCGTRRYSLKDTTHSRLVRVELRGAKCR